jgi:hypothetical protein
MQNTTDAFRPSPACPHCGISIKFATSFPNFGAGKPLLSFDCIMCGLSVTEAADPVEPAGKAAA